MLRVPSVLEYSSTGGFANGKVVFSQYSAAVQYSEYSITRPVVLQY